MYGPHPSWDASTANPSPLGARQAGSTAIAALLLVLPFLSGCDDSLGVTNGGDDGSDEKGLTFEVDEITVDEGDSAEIRVFPTDSAGTTGEELPPSQVHWSSSDSDIAAVDSGEVKGKDAGKATIEAFKDGYGTATVEVHVEAVADGGTTLRPNEPEGMDPWFHHDMQSLPDGPASHEGVVPWTTYGGNYTIEDVDPEDHPLGRSSLLQIRFPEGHSDGASPGAFGAVDQGTTDSSTELDEWYVSVHVKLVGPDWEVPPSDQKLWYNRIGHRSTHQGGFVSLRGGGSPNTESSDWSFIQSQYRNCQNCVGDINVGSVSGGFTVGQWHHIELWRQSSDHDTPNGKMKVWVNGQLVVDLNDVLDQSTENGDWTTGFYSLHWAPVWGGVCSGGCPKTRDDHMLLGDMYVSGNPR